MTEPAGFILDDPVASALVDEYSRQLPEPIRLRGRDGPWQRLRTDLARVGTGVVHAEVGDWLPAEASGARLRRLLGRDWDRYARLNRDDVRARFAASRALLKYAAGAVLNVEPHTLELAYGPTGRPYLRGCPQIDLSLSHTRDLLVVALTRRGMVGVDAELADRRMGPSAHRRMCTPYEIERIERMSPEQRNQDLIRLWTLKEAYSKAIGQGLRFKFTEFGFGPQGRLVRLLLPDGTPAAGDEWTLGSYALDDRYRISVAIYDAGLGEPAETAVDTMLDDSIVSALTTVLGSLSRTPALVRTT
jgi:4'-phosphopantetheinyl transferase